MTELPPTHPIRLGLALNFSVSTMKFSTLQIALVDLLRLHLTTPLLSWIPCQKSLTRTALSSCSRCGTTSPSGPLTCKARARRNLPKARMEQRRRWKMLRTRASLRRLAPHLVFHIWAQIQLTTTNIDSASEAVEPSKGPLTAGQSRVAKVSNLSN